MARQSSWKIPRSKSNLGIATKVRRKLGKKAKSSSTKFRNTYMGFYNELPKVKKAKEKYAKAHSKPTKRKSRKKATKARKRRK